MKDDCSFSWFRIARAKGIGPASLWEIYDSMERSGFQVSDLVSCQSFQNVSSLKKLKSKLTSSLSQQDEDKIYREFERLENNRVKILHPEFSDFPIKLKQFGRKYGIPPVLYARGYTPLANVPSISIVGSRNVEEAALFMASELAKDLAYEGYNIVSGYAKGIDSAAHLGALEAEGTTTIVLSLGILNFEAKKDFKPWFSARNTLVISQFNPTDKWMARHAMARNKLVCALSDATIVIASGKEVDDCGKMSGTFDAAKTAMNMNLPVFVLSPNCFDVPPEGNDDLIRLGGHAISPKNAIERILSTLNRPSMKLSQNSQSSLQLDLFSPSQVR
ncbi:MAG: hypothetical protein D6822_06085 [Cyanobacteria bacterium J149]|nr:MAG: hypothetical protein D6822_06085 [Cyanobacteria bacterium J149]